jgi:3-oxoacyl-[acyl-carrier-protein] synthase-1/3-oxoacyl-[acyl-carrier-protein] synthase II
MRDADRMVVLAADEAGPAALDLLRATSCADRPFVEGAVAILLDACPEAALAAIDPDTAPAHETSPIGHLALVERLRQFGNSYF